MAPIRRLVVDVLKPHDPVLVEFTQHISDLDGVAGVSASLIERDKQVQNVELTFEGESLDVDALEATIEDLGGTVHSVDQVVCGDTVVQDRPTAQDT